MRSRELVQEFHETAQGGGGACLLQPARSTRARAHERWYRTLARIVTTLNDRAI